MNRLSLFLIAGWLSLCPPVVIPATAADMVQVFILAGQSNMEGHGNVELTEQDRARMTKQQTFQRDKNGYLEYLAKQSPDKQQFKHLLDGDGNWAQREDVWFAWKKPGRDAGQVVSKLTVGLGAGEPGRIGPELQFGHVMGDHFQEPVLLIKTAWGGKSLAIDFRPPGAGMPESHVLQSRLDRLNEDHVKNKREPISMAEMKREYGLYYRQMIDEVDDTLNHLGSLFPEYRETDGYRIAGFVWFQGWNDGQSIELASEYEENLVHLVQDVRQKYGPIPVVIGSSGFGKHAPSPHDGWVNRLRLHVEPAQIAAAARLENAECFETGDCLIPHPDRTSNSGIHHWFNSAETYFLIGDGLGKTMKTLLD